MEVERQEDQKFKTTLGYIILLSQKRRWGPERKGGKKENTVVKKKKKNLLRFLCDSLTNSLAWCSRSKGLTQPSVL